MSAWWPTLDVGLVAALLLILPGLACVYVAGLRGIVAWGVAPLASVAIVSTTAIGASELGVSWSTWPVLAAMLVWTALAWIVRLLAKSWRGPRTARTAARRRLTLTVAPIALVSSLWTLLRLMKSIGKPTNVAQVGDTVYHLNAVRFILTNHDGSSLRMTLATPGAKSTFYPAAWHDVTSLVVQLTGTPIPTAALWVSIMCAVLVWPLSLLALGRVLFGPRPLLLAATATVSLLFYQFPMMFLHYGVVYPNLLSEAMTPAFIACVYLALLRARGRQRIAPFALVAAGIIALTLSEPNSVIAAIYFLLPLAFLMAWRKGRKLRRKGVWAVLSLWPSVVLIVGIAAAWVATNHVAIIKAFRTIHVPGRVPLGVGVWNAVTLEATHPANAPNWLMAVLAIIGLVACVFVKRWRWLPFSWAIFVLLYTASVGVTGRMLKIPHITDIQAQLVGYWYSAWERLAATLPLVAAPLAAIGLAVVVRLLLQLLARNRARWHVMACFRSPVLRKPTAIILTVACSLATVAGTFTKPVNDGFTQTAVAYSPIPNPKAPACKAASPTFSCSLSGGLLSEKEAAFLSTAAKLVPPGYLIAGNPYDGSSLIWALDNRPVLYPVQGMHLYGIYDLVATFLWQATSNPSVCSAVRDLHVGYVLILGGSELWQGYHEEYSGLYLSPMDGVGSLIAQAPGYTPGSSMQLWKITACGTIPPLS